MPAGLGAFLLFVNRLLGTSPTTVTYRAPFTIVDESDGATLALGMDEDYPLTIDEES